MKRQGGFTLIELVVVIVILGILAVTAAPRFLNLQDDARDATLEGLRGAIAGGMGISYGKAAINDVEAAQWTAANTNDIDGVQHSFGYPIAANANVTMIWLVTVKEYGNIPIILANRTNINSVNINGKKDLALEPAVSFIIFATNI